MLNSNTIKQLIQFAKNVTSKGLLNEIPDVSKMNDNDPYLNTYIQAITLIEYVSELKKNDTNEWNKLKDIKLRHWADPRQNGNVDTFENMLNEMNKRRCVTDCMA